MTAISSSPSITNITTIAFISKNFFSKRKAFLSNLVSRLFHIQTDYIYLLFLPLVKDYLLNFLLIYWLLK
ncbi:hypothetical protein PW52_14255 [Tamlana sedimentorum]|uniref:Uncharacterized protein n=1 Tax=Neotamlana sedimentorum TaxID=1435349 RepID=A0A0D7W5V8_9FLAO|nr:hypothetical protein PW52_14255 [Tamlana sedimentorum]